MKTYLLVALLAAFSAGCASKKADKPVAPPAPPQIASIEEAVANPARTPENVMRDQYRHPVDTLKFFGVTPEMKVVEVAPGAGWYTEILAPLLNGKGQYVAAMGVPKGDEQNSGNQKRKDWMSAHAVQTDKAQTVEFSPDHLDMGIDNSADMVLTFRNVHNWMGVKADQKAFNSFFKTLKPGGILGVVEHRENPHHKQNALGKTGYVREDYVIKLAKKAGFKLVARSEINANPKDTKNYKKGVWTLPPSYQLGDKDHAKYQAIGESDRMTLKFMKPEAAK